MLSLQILAMRLSIWLAAAAAVLMMPSTAVAEEGPTYTYAPEFRPQVLPAAVKPTLTWDASQKQATFHYNVTTASDTNWIGVFYAYGGEPVNGTKHMDPLTWEYAPGKEGTVRLNMTGLERGAFRAYLMAEDTYEPLAPPVAFNPGQMGNVGYLTYRLNMRPAREGQYWSYDPSKMADIAGDERNLYSMIYCDGDGWVNSTPQGILYGTPTAKSKRKTSLAVKVTSGRHLSYFMEATVDVRGPDEPMVTELKVMSMNMWYGGTKVDKFHAKQVDYISQRNVDIVGLQETNGVHALRLAHALGWWAYQTWDASIISRYPIVEALNSTAKSATGSRSSSGPRT